jgi:hypothetical protein
MDSEFSSKKIDYIELEECKLSFYCEDKIPEQLLMEVEKCKQLGVKQDMIYVYYPIKHSSSKKIIDPLLVIKQKYEDGETEYINYFLIGRWV